MMTIKDFVGAVLGEIARARVLSDGASARIADQYLNHDILKSFPVPRMHIRDIQFEMSFAVSPVQNGAPPLDDEEVRKNIIHRVRDLVQDFADHPEFKDYFGKDDGLRSAWNDGLAPLSARFLQILKRPATDPAGLSKHLALTVENYFYECAPVDLRSGLSKLLERPLRRDELGEVESMRATIANRVAAVVNSAANVKPTSAPEEPLNVTMLVGAQELENLRPELLHKLRISVDPSDRKWVTLNQSGEKTYILDKN